MPWDSYTLTKVRLTQRCMLSFLIKVSMWWLRPGIEKTFYNLCPAFFNIINPFLIHPFPTLSSRPFLLPLHRVYHPSPPSGGAGDSTAISYLTEALKNSGTNDVVQHGACLGVGLAAMATGDEVHSPPLLLPIPSLHSSQILLFFPSLLSFSFTLFSCLPFLLLPFYPILISPIPVPSFL